MEAATPAIGNLPWRKPTSAPGGAHMWKHGFTYGLRLMEAHAKKKLCPMIWNGLASRRSDTFE
jgi:hypothetical protein